MSNATNLTDASETEIEQAIHSIVGPSLKWVKVLIFIAPVICGAAGYFSVSQAKSFNDGEKNSVELADHDQLQKLTVTVDGIKTDIIGMRIGVARIEGALGTKPVGDK